MSKYQIQQINRNNGPEHIPAGTLTGGLLELPNGDWLFGDNKDLVHCTLDEARAQAVLAAIKTVYDKSPAFPLFGTRIRDIIGNVTTDTFYQEAGEILIEDMINSGFPVISEGTEVLPYDDSTIIVSIVVEGIQQPKISLSYLFNVFDASVEELGGLQV